MADGGIHDQLGGGFHRYATDAVWLVPHFEQMLYDNAQLARVYVHAWAVTGDARYRDVAIGTLDYMIRELTTDDGAFAASQDADTDGVEGADVRLARGRDPRGPRRRRRRLTAAYGVTDEGNWEGRTILAGLARSACRRCCARTPRSRPVWPSHAPTCLRAVRPARNRPEPPTPPPIIIRRK